MRKRFKKLSFKKKILLIILMLIVSGLIVQRVAFPSKNGKFNLGKVTRSNITETVTETGSISVSGNVVIASPTNGVVTEILVQNGDEVKVGQVLFKIKSTATEQEKSLAYSNYLTAKNSLSTATANADKLQATMFDKWDSYKELAESDDYETSDGAPKSDSRNLPEFYIPQKEWQGAEKDYQKQQSVISQTQAAVNSAYLQYQATQNAIVKATADGKLVNLSVAPNSTVTATSTKPLAIITNSVATEVAVSLSENDIVKVKEGQQAEVDLKAVQGKVYHGIVKRVDMIRTEEKGLIRYYTYIELTDADDQLRPGMNVDARIITNQKDDVLSVPNAAVKPYQGGKAVRIAGKKGAIEYKMIEVGIRGKERTEITRGLEENQEIILSLSNEQLKRQSVFGN